jgi:hypothetical protein
MESSFVGLRVSSDLKERLNAKAMREGKTLSELMKELIETSVSLSGAENGVSAAVIRDKSSTALAEILDELKVYQEKLEVLERVIKRNGGDDAFFGGAPEHLLKAKKACQERLNEIIRQIDQLFSTSEPRTTQKSGDEIDDSDETGESRPPSAGEKTTPKRKYSDFCKIL